MPESSQIVAIPTDDALSKISQRMNMLARLAENSLMQSQPLDTLNWEKSKALHSNGSDLSTNPQHLSDSNLSGVDTKENSKQRPQPMKPLETVEEHDERVIKEEAVKLLTKIIGSLPSRTRALIEQMPKTSTELPADAEMLDLFEKMHTKIGRQESFSLQECASLIYFSNMVLSQNIELRNELYYLTGIYLKETTKSIFTSFKG